MSLPLLKKKAQAIKMREGGASYSQIKKHLGVSKGSLSLWLRDMPLPEARLRELRDFSAVRIEKYRETRRKQREARRDQVRAHVATEIGTLGTRDFFIAGLFLYWGEGGKTKYASLALSNNDPAMIRFFVRWLGALGVSKDQLKVRVHLYNDMDVQKELMYWENELELPRSCFRNPYIKKSNRSGITYVQRFTHGTCNLIYDNRDTAEYVLGAVEHLRDQFARR